MGLIDLDKFLRENCIDRMEGKSCEECKHHVLEVSCERLMEQPTIDPVKRGRWGHLALDDKRLWASTPIRYYDHVQCSCCGKVFPKMFEELPYCGVCGSRMDGEEE